MYPIIRSLRRYRGRDHSVVLDKLVLVVAMHRCPEIGEIAHDDADGLPLQPDDLIEYSALLFELDGTQRASRSSSLAGPTDFGPPEGMWEGAIAATSDLNRRPTSVIDVWGGC